MICGWILLLCALRCGAQEAFTLPNGLRVVMRERHASPLVGIDLWVRAGAREESAEEVGSAHFLEHLLFKGTRTRGPGEADAEIENLGATLNAATGPDAVHFTTTVARAHLTRALAVLADVVRNATLPDAEVERERGVILDELAQHEGDADARLLDLLYARAFDTHPYRRSPGGTAAAIRARGRDTLAAFYRRVYTPERCVLALAGDLTPERARQEAERAFGDWQSPTPIRTAALLPDARPLESEPTAPRSLSAPVETNRGQIGIAFRAPAAGDAVMACTAQVVAALLGESQRAGRLTALAGEGIEASARYTPRRDPGLFVLDAALPPANAADIPARLARLESTLLSLVNALQTAPPTIEEIAAAQRAVLGRAQFDVETNAGLARALGYAEITGGDSPERFRARVLRLTRADILRFVQRYLDPTRRVAVKLLPTHTDEESRRK
ncbi:MAG TPA: pitrilysin family protein [Chthonomonadaceae bacterium]|nr:pitrilysin family protein [Chthonomonadaceae bacterium]